MILGEHHMPNHAPTVARVSLLLSILIASPPSLDAAAPLTWVDSQRDIPRTDGRSVAVSPDGRSLYMTGRGWLMASERNPETGDLTFLRAYFADDPAIEGLLDPNQVLVSPDGEQVYVSSPGNFISASCPDDRSLPHGARKLARFQAVRARPQGREAPAVTDTQAFASCPMPGG
jgi:hypothetical protein